LFGGRIDKDTETKVIIFDGKGRDVKGYPKNILRILLNIP
jgi:hypothetical protein